MSEHITRGQFMRFFQIAIRRGPAGLRKEWLYANLKPMVDALEKDLKAAQEAAENEPQEPKEQPVEQVPQEQAENEAQAENEPVKEPAPEPAKEPAKKADKKDLGDNPKKPARKGKK